MLVVVKGGGDLGSGVAHCLVRAGMAVVITEIARPTVVRRAVSFAQAVFGGQIEVEGITARLASDTDAIASILADGEIAVIVDPMASIVQNIKPSVVVDAILAKKNTGTSMNDAPLVIALGPGFTAGVDVHAVIETNRGPDLGRVIYSGSAQADTGIPALTAGYTYERVLRAPTDGIFMPTAAIGDILSAGEQVGSVAGIPVAGQIAGALRGLIHTGVFVKRGEKIGDIDPRSDGALCFRISDKARKIGEGVCKAIDRWTSIVKG